MTKINYKFSTPYRNIDDQTITNNLYLLQDCYLDEANAIHKRFGFSNLLDLGTNASIDGCFWWDFYECFIVISGGNVYKVTDVAGNYVQIGTGIMQLNTRVTFAEIYDITNSELRLFFSNGGSIYYTNGTICTEVTGASAPSRCTHVAGIDTYLVCNDLDYPFLWRASEVENPTVINQAYSAQYSTDKINGVYVYNKRIYITGRKSIEPYYNSGDTVPFRPISGAVIEKGIASSYAFKVSEDGIFYFSYNRELNVMTAYTPSVISGEYNRRIQDFNYVNDVEVDYISGLNGRKICLVHFNDKKLTLSYDFDSKCFSEYGSWNGSSYNQFIGRCYAYSNLWNIHIMGDRNTGKIYKISEDYTNDAGNAIRSEIITANYNHGTFEIKQSKSLFIDVRRGDGLSGSSGKLILQHRDNKNNVWSNQLEIDLGSKGDTLLGRKITPMGMYTTRQYRFIMQDNCKFVLNGMEEEVESKTA